MDGEAKCVIACLGLLAKKHPSPHHATGIYDTSISRFAAT
jgi:hypothetical protein